MAISKFYVHWYYNNKTKKKQKSRYDANYNEKIAERLSKIKGRTLATRFKKIIKNTYKFSSSSEVTKFLQNEKDLLKQGGFLNAIDEAFTVVNNAAPMFDWSNEKILNSLKDPYTEAVTFNKELEKTIRQMVQFLNHCTNIMNRGDTQDYLFFLEKYSKNTPGLQEALLQLKDSKQDVKLMTKAKEKNIESEFKELKNEEQELQTYLTQLRALNADNKSKKVNQETANKNIVGFIRSLFIEQAQKAGELVEIIATDTINAMVATSLIQLPKSKGIKVTHTGNLVPKQGFNKYTTDMKIQLRADMPATGITIKRYKSYAANKTKLDNIHLKNAKVKSMLNVMQSVGLFDNAQRSAFYNIMANHRRHVSKSASGGGGGAIYKYNSINEYFHSLNKIMLIPAIAGSLTSEDLSTLFLINGDIYSIVDILAHADEGSISSNLSTINKKVRAEHRWVKSTKGTAQQDDKIAAAERSKKIIDNILDNTLRLSLSLSLARIRKL